MNHVSMLDVAEAFPIAVALDKDNPDRLYIACGVNGVLEGKLCISEDYGESFTYKTIPTMVLGNLSGRGTGMRLVVDERCAWAGSQKYGVLTWSGDIHSSFRAMREQLQAGLNMCVAGIPWWTSDIGGFVGGDIKDPYFKELLVRWFAWGCFCPVFRMHGERSPWYEREEEFINNVRQLTSGQDNEVWSFGGDNYEILKKYLFIRERLRPYIRECMRQASLTGAPIMRPLFFDFNGDEMAWETEDEYMFGPDILVAPVMEEKVTQRSVYLPAGAAWTDANTGEVYRGGQSVVVPAPLDIIPVFFRDGKKYDIYQ